MAANYPADASLNHLRSGRRRLRHLWPASLPQRVGLRRLRARTSRPVPARASTGSRLRSPCNRLCVPLPKPTWSCRASAKARTTAGGHSIIWHVSWLEDAALDTLRTLDVALVAADTAGKHPLCFERTAGFARVHGDYKACIASAERAEALRREIDPTDLDAQADPLNLKGVCLERTGQDSTAYGIFQRVLDMPRL